MSSPAELRCPASYCSILCTRRRNRALSSPSRDVSLCSRVIGGGRGIPPENLPGIEVMRQAYRLFGGVFGGWLGLGLTIIRGKLVGEIAPNEKTLWR